MVNEFESSIYFLPELKSVDEVFVDQIDSQVANKQNEKQTKKNSLVRSRIIVERENK